MAIPTPPRTVRRWRDIWPTRARANPSRVRASPISGSGNRRPIRSSTGATSRVRRRPMKRASPRFGSRPLVDEAGLHRAEDCFEGIPEQAESIRSDCHGENSRDDEGGEHQPAAAGREPSDQDDCSKRECRNDVGADPRSVQRRPCGAERHHRHEPRTTAGGAIRQPADRRDEEEDHVPDLRPGRPYRSADDGNAERPDCTNERRRRRKRDDEQAKYEQDNCGCHQSPEHADRARSTNGIGRQHGHVV